MPITCTTLWKVFSNLVGLPNVIRSPDEIGDFPQLRMTGEFSSFLETTPVFGTLVLYHCPHYSTKFI